MIIVTANVGLLPFEIGKKKAYITDNYKTVTTFNSLGETLKNLLPLVFGVVLGVACFLPAPASAYYYRGRYYSYYYRGHYYPYYNHGHYYRYHYRGPGLSASMGVRGIIAIGKRLLRGTALTTV
jgi:hypothetical protein